ncbi:MAG: hypothetical protein LBU12_06820 [Deltaproteobacteria bacterium]|jgi:hypothetical protein|nr:hypothetical protein [Deltaproteobacteria bacterium]
MPKTELFAIKAENVKLRQEIERLARENSELRLKVMTGVVQICSDCRQLKTSDGHWVPLDRWLEMYAQVSCSHGYCEECAKKLLDEAAL